jgi:hypothetical protein
MSSYFKVSLDVADLTAADVDPVAYLRDHHGDVGGCDSPIAAATRRSAGPGPQATRRFAMCCGWSAARDGRFPGTSTTTTRGHWMQSTK